MYGIIVDPTGLIQKTVFRRRSYSSVFSIHYIFSWTVVKVFSLLILLSV